MIVQLVPYVCDVSNTLAALDAVRPVFFSRTDLIIFLAISFTVFLTVVPTGVSFFAVSVRLSVRLPLPGAFNFHV